MAGINRQTLDPQGGWFGRDADGNPDGRIVEIGAMNVIRRLRKARTFDEEVALLCSLRHHYLSLGILAVTDMMADRSALLDPLSVWRAAVQNGLPLDVSLYVIWTGKKNPGGMKDLAPDEKKGRVRIAGVKLFADGSVSGQTAAVRVPYCKRQTDEKDNYGFLSLDRETLLAAISYARRNRIQVAIHVMGDRSLDRIFDSVEDVSDWMELVPSIRLEHVTFLNPDQIERMHRLHVRIGVATQVIFPFAEWRSYEDALDPFRMDNTYPIKSISSAIFPLALSSDAPCTTWAEPDDIFTSIEAAVTRRNAAEKFFGKNQAIDTAQALSLYMTRAASLYPHEGQFGRIRPGYRANFVVLTKNPLKTDPTQLHSIRVARLWRDGVELLPL